jgi:regulator of cell morphogenesis and NO signaling
LIDKIVNVHGARHPELIEVQRLYAQLRADMEVHLAQEEQELFPMIREIATSDRTTLDAAAFTAQFDALTADHETVGSLLEDLSRVTSRYTTPDDGCASYAACYRALAELEADTHLHVHKENNQLFVAARAQLAGSTMPTT